MVGVGRATERRRVQRLRPAAGRALPGHPARPADLLPAGGVFAPQPVDEPRALRLWWEYLECVDWRTDFYDTLVTLQSRSPTYA